MPLDRSVSKMTRIDHQVSWFPIKSFYFLHCLHSAESLLAVKGILKYCRRSGPAEGLAYAGAGKFQPSGPAPQSAVVSATFE